MLELAGFALIGLLFFIWMLGRNEQSNLQGNGFNEPATLSAGIGGKYAKKKNRNYEEETTIISSDAYHGEGFDAPTPVYSRKGNSESKYDDVESRGDYGKPSARSKKKKAKKTYKASSATAIRSWKGVHRDEDYARAYVREFQEDIMYLSNKYGLYPEVFMARVIAYSYDFVEQAGEIPMDNNLTGMRRPKGDGRALFESPKEALRAYAVVNAGEITRLSLEGAFAKHDRAWTMRKIAGNFEIERNLEERSSRRRSYTGLVGPANKLSSKESYQRELEGEMMDMYEKVDETVKSRRAKSAGFDRWEDYLENVPEDRRTLEEENTQEIINAVSRKKSLNLGRRVDAKKRKMNQ